MRIATKATDAIVATTDKRQEVKDFGRDLGIVVLDGNFLQKLTTSDTLSEQRISEEEFFEKINDYELNKLDGDWKGRIKYCKSLLAKPLSFDTCNEWLLNAKFFIEQAITKENQKEIALRCLYLLCSFTAIAIDYCMREISFYETTERSRLIKEGCTYGARGSSGIKKVLNLAMGLVEENALDGTVISKQVRKNIEFELSKLNTVSLGEYFSKNEVARSLFSVAKEFEQLAMNKSFVSHAKGSSELRSMLFCFIDYWEIDRQMLSGK
ncbi:hypothetical protein SDC9_147277 [bioreactor metagenome]|uniref:Uncharacterized protein n=1 Tax=bioreactor metagenome TaxID=1076179 RepID=A0A645EHL5_9ZZZZ